MVDTPGFRRAAVLMNNLFDTDKPGKARWESTDSGLYGLLFVMALTLLACAPAIVIAVWKAAL